MSNEPEPSIIANQDPGFQNESAIKCNPYLPKAFAIACWLFASFSLYELIKFIAASISEPDLFYSLESFPIKTIIGGEEGPTVIFGRPLAYLISLALFHSVLFSFGGWYCWKRDYKKQGVAFLIFLMVNILFSFLTSISIPD